MILKNVKTVNFLLISFFISFCFSPCVSQSAADSVTRSCNAYDSFRSWLPDAYISNAKCACNQLVFDHAAAIIRSSLIDYLTHTDSQLIKTAVIMKQRRHNGKISRLKYKKFVKRKIAPLIYKQHKDAFQTAGCTKGPAKFWVWKIATTRRFKNCNRMFRYNIRFGGGCFGKNGAW